MAKLRLNTGQYTVFDDELLPLFQNLSWGIGSKGYVHAWYKGKFIKMHHCVIGKPLPPKIVDHINRNPLDNRRINLRIATMSQNGFNRGLGINNKSGYSGVFKITTRGRWIYWKAKLGTKYLGSFKTKKEAVQARKLAEKENQNDQVYSNLR